MINRLVPHYSQGIVVDPLPKFYGFLHLLLHQFLLGVHVINVDYDVPILALGPNCVYVFGGVGYHRLGLVVY